MKRVADLFLRPLVVAGGSEHSLAAMHHALILAAAANGKVTALVVREALPRSMGVYARGDTLRRFTDDWRRTCGRAAEESARQLRELGQDLDQDVDVKIEKGDLLERLAEATSEATMVAAGQQLRAGGGEGIGQGVELLLRKIRRPILLAPGSYVRPEKVVVAYGGKELGPTALAMGALAARTLGLPLEIFIAAGAEVRGQIAHRARRELGGSTPAATFTGHDGDPGTRILEHCSGRDLLVMGAYGHSRLYRAVLGSVTNQVIHQARWPILISGRPASE